MTGCGRVCTGKGCCDLRDAATWGPTDPVQTYQAAFLNKLQKILRCNKF